MKRILFFLPVLLFATTITYAGSIINDIEHFSKLFPRIEGSANEKETFSYIIKKLENLDINYRTINFSESDGYHSFSLNLDVEIKGSIDDTLITIIPMDVADGTSDRFSGSYGIAAALMLIEHYVKVKPDLSLRFIFLGAEKGKGDKYPLGTRNFLETFFPENPTAFIYLNFDKLPSAFRLISGANGYSSPFWLNKSLTKTLRQTGIPYYHSDIETILFRLSAAGDDSMIADYLAEGYPAIEITDFPTINQTSIVEENINSITSDEFIGFYNLMINSLSSGFPQDWDSHYLFNLSEQQYLILYIVLIMLLMIYPIFRRRQFGWYMRSLLKNFWIIPVLFGFIFGLLSVSSILLKTLLNALQFPNLWQYFSLPFFILKLSVTLFAYSLLIKLISKLPFSKRGSFYSMSAIFFLVISMFVLTWIDLSLSFFTLWPLFFMFIFSIMKKPPIKFLLLILSAAWLIYGLTEIFLLHSIKVIELITFSPAAGNLILSLILLPFILASIRLDMLLHPSIKVTRFAPAVFGTISAGLLVLILIYNPFNDSNPQPVTIIKLIEENKTDVIKIDSPAALPSRVREDLQNSIMHSVEEIDIINIQVESEAFLNRKIVRTILDLPESPEKIRVVLESENSITLFESSYPTTWFPSQNRLEIYIGKNPPAPLEFSLTLNRDAEINYSITAEYPILIEKKRILDNIYLINYRKTLTKHYSNAD
jgi:hypothetical protein